MKNINRNIPGNAILVLSLMTLVFHANAVFYLTITHQNDIHGHFGQEKTFFSPCEEIDEYNELCTGGFARSVGVVKDIKADNFNENVLNVNSGDFFKGTAFYSVFKWRMVADLVKEMPYDALALGNAEFVDGLAGLLPFMRAVGPLFVCTNLDFGRLANASLRAELSGLCPAHRVVHFGAQKVAVLGYTSPVTTRIARVGSVVFRDEVTALTTEVATLRAQGLKIFVAIGHSGYERDKEIALRVPSLDVIVGGHSHTLLWEFGSDHFAPQPPEDVEDARLVKGLYPTKVIQPSGRTVLITQMYKHGKYIGVLNVTFNDDGEVVDYFPRPMLLLNSLRKDKQTARVLARYAKLLQQKKHEVIGHTLVQLIGNFDKCHREECNMGNLMAEAILWSLQKRRARGFPMASVVLLNAGSMKFNIPRGNLTLADLIDVLPYQNTIDVLEIRGTTLRKAMENSVSRVDELHGCFLQLAGVRVKYNLAQPVGRRVVSLAAACHDCLVPRFEPVTPRGTYRVAVTTFVADGGDGYTMLQNEALTMTPVHELDLDVVVEYLRRMSPVYPRRDGRIQTVHEAPVKSGGRSSQLGPPPAAYCLLFASLTVLY